MANFRTPLSKFKQNQSISNSKSPSMNLPPSPFLEKLGYGTGVQVYLYERPLKGNFVRSPWAVKKVCKRPGMKNANLYEKRLKEEASILKELNHENIIAFRALLNAPTGKKICLAMEYGQESLFDLIEIRMEESLGSFSSVKILKVACDLSNALSYLHNEKQLLHGDIKSGNVLIRNDFKVVKLCDFGVTVKLDKNMKALGQYIGTAAWSAMEVHKQLEITDRTDMFSFGMVLYEMLTLNIPYGHIFPLEEDFASTREYESASMEAETEYDNLLGTRPSLPSVSFDKSYNPVIELLFACTDERAQNRPSAQDTHQALINKNNPQMKLKF